MDVIRGIGSQTWKYDTSLSGKPAATGGLRDGFINRVSLQSDHLILQEILFGFYLKTMSGVCTLAGAQSLRVKTSQGESESVSGSVGCAGRGGQMQELPQSAITRYLLGVPRASRKMRWLRGQNAHTLWQAPPQEAGAPASHLSAARGCRPGVTPVHGRLSTSCVRELLRGKEVAKWPVGLWWLCLAFLLSLHPPSPFPGQPPDDCPPGSPGQPYLISQSRKHLQLNGDAICEFLTSLSLTEMILSQQSGDTEISQLAPQIVLPRDASL